MTCQDGLAQPLTVNGSVVAYQTRYETRGVGRATAIKFMTDGVLLEEARHDLLLRRYACIVLDEVLMCVSWDPSQSREDVVRMTSSSLNQEERLSYGRRARRGVRSLV